MNERNCRRPPREFGKSPAWLIHGARALAATVLGREARASGHYTQALIAGASALAVGEIARMAHLFCGFPRAIQGLRALDRALRGHGVQLPLQDSSAPHSHASRSLKSRSRVADRARGEQLFRRIYREHADAVLAQLDGTIRGFSSWVLEDAYARVLTRAGLTDPQRELLAVAALCALNSPAQLKSHLRGALNVGATLTALRVLLQGLKGWVAPASLRYARELLTDFARAR